MKIQKTDHMYNKHLDSSDRLDKSCKYVIVNADDFGYYDCVSRGILSAADLGAVTATGIFANSPFLDSHLHWLEQCDSLDTGVHLNLTDRSPLTPALRARLHRWNGHFPGKFITACLILTGRLPFDEVTQELRAQVERCLAAGVKISFLNSHEHIHMLPPVFRITQDLATEYGIHHVRYSLPDEMSPFTPGDLIRDLALNMLGKKNSKSLTVPVLPILGMATSGKLNLAYLRRVMRGLSPGVYELMCHPGACGREDVHNPALHAYHDWRGELDVLTSNGFRILCRQENIRLIGYRHIKIINGQIEVNIETQ
jgi:predicted glycoside hydrolase/deacetylase ChbG (UPF0249 family)